MTKRAAIYLRLSAAADDSTSIGAQEATLRELAGREGWTIDPRHVLTDEGISGRKARANADRAIDLLRTGEVDVLAVYKLDRLSRQGLGALAMLIAALDEQPGALFVAHADGLRSSQPAWRIIASVLAEVARMEAENTAARMRTAVEHRHNIGRHTGGPAPFGYRTADAPDGGKVLIIDPEEAALVRRMADRLLSGVGVATLARELREAGIPTAKSEARLARMAGKPETGERGFWDATTVRRLLTSDRIAGRVTHKGRLVTDEDGLPVTHYEPVLEPDVVERIRAHLAPASRPVPPRRAERLLSGVAFCASCGARLWVAQGRAGAPTYRCPGRGCKAQAYMRAEHLERYVVDSFLSVVGNWPELEEVETVDSSTAAALADVERAADQLLADIRSARGSERAALAAKLDSLDARADVLRATPSTVSVEVRPTGRTMREAWEVAEDDHERRRTLGLGLDHVTVAPNAGPTGRRVNLERVALFWHPPREG